VALLDIAVTSVDLDGECRTQEIFSGLEGRDQFLGGQNGVGKSVSIRVVVDLADRLGGPDAVRGVWGPEAQEAPE